MPRQQRFPPAQSALERSRKRVRSSRSRDSVLPGRRIQFFPYIDHRIRNGRKSQERSALDTTTPQRADRPLFAEERNRAPRAVS